MTDTDGVDNLVDHDHVAKLLRVLETLHPTQQKQEEKSIVQLIPKKVWESNYVDYKHAFPNSTFKDKSLKEHYGIVSLKKYKVKS